ncbi:MAG: FtsX-like permease family protein [Cyanobium sp. MAG06]|nr:FtsX-like permease family protein [Cyanobium sp. MAG06]
MVISFLNLVVISGILQGLIEGNIRGFRTKYLGDLIISRLDKENKINNVSQIYSILNNNPLVENYNFSYRYSGKIEANYKNKKTEDSANERQTSLIGINPSREDKFSNLSENIIEGEYLQDGDSGYVLLGYNMISKYSVIKDADPTVLRDIEPGSKVKIKVNNGEYEYTVKGIVKIKVGDLSNAVFMLDRDIKNIANLNNDNISMIAIRAKSPELENSLKLQKVLLNNNIGEYAKIETFEEGTPEFVIQMSQLFGLMGNFLGVIGILVATITLSIVIFINVITKKRQIGIMKGIGINRGSIIFSYCFQSIFYAVIGIGIGLIITYFMLQPYFDANPINFPFSDGILVADAIPTSIKVALLTFFALLSGFVPARMIVHKNTLDSILDK